MGLDSILGRVDEFMGKAAERVGKPAVLYPILIPYLIFRGATLLAEALYLTQRDGLFGSRESTDYFR